MRNFLIVVVAAVAVWFLFFRAEPTVDEPIAPVAQASPQKQFDAVLSSGTVDAAPLATLCSSYPQLGAQLLNGRQIRLRGTVAQVRTSGMEGRRADVVLNGGGPRRIMLVCDLDQYSGPGVGFRYLGKFEAVGTELLYLVRRDRTLTKKVVITQGADVTQFCTLKSMGASLIEFRMVDGPTWARAETNH